MARMFGLEMSKGSKRTLFICIPIAVICLVVYFVLALFEVAPEEQVLMPVGGLTESIFDSQNLVYVKEEAFTVKNGFKNIPYTIETVDGKKASVGNANIYEHTPYYFYYSEMKEGDSIEGVLKAELTSVLSVTADPLSTELTVLRKESGFINGCVADYFVYQISVDNGDGSSAVQYLCLYKLHFDESIYDTEWSMLVGCVSNTYSTTGLSVLQTLASSSIYTLQYDSAAARLLETGE